MNLAQLTQLVRSHLARSRGGPPEGGVIRRALNEAQAVMSTELDRPTAVDVVESATMDIPLPPDAKPSGVKSVRDAKSEQTLELVRVQDADALYPGWHKAGAGPDGIVVYDPGTVGRTLRLTRLPADQGLSGTFLVTCVVEPAEMVKPKDAPMNGLVTEFHHLLAYYAAFSLSGNERFLALYERGMRRAQGAYRDESLYPKNPLWRAQQRRW